MNRVEIVTCLIKNLLVTSVIGWALWFCMKHNRGYEWVYNSYLKNNWEFIRNNPDLTEEQRYTLKLGISYTYLQFIKQNTPEDAVILYPTKEDFFPPGTQSPFQGEVYNLSWATRFLYPRKIIFPEQMRQNIFSPEISHIAIVNGRGFDRITNYQGERFEHGVLPVKTTRGKNGE